MPATPLTLPPALDSLLARLESAGHPAFLVGRAIPQLIRGEVPLDFEVWAVATQDQLRRCFPFAVTGVRSRWLIVPSDAGPVDLYTLPHVANLERSLATRDVTLHAIAYRAADKSFIDPLGGLQDLDAGRLRAIGDVDAMLSRDPLRALRVVRLASREGLTLDPALRDALSLAAPRIKAMRGPRVRRELDALLQEPQVATGIRILRETGLEAAVVPGARDDAPDVVARVGPDLTLRWAAWLRETSIVLIMRNLRMPRDKAARIERWLRRHPVDDGNASALAARARRLLHGDSADREPLLALRSAEIDPQDMDALAQLDRLRQALARQREADAAAASRQALAIDGRQVMAHLDCGPGAFVGQALEHLAACITEDPTLNETQELLARLDLWWADHQATSG